MGGMKNRYKIPLVLFCLLLIWPYPGPGPGAVVSPLTEPITDRQWKQMGALVLDCVRGLGGGRGHRAPGAIIRGDPGFDRPGRTLFFVSLSDGRTPARVNFAEGPALNAAFSNCMVNLYGDKAAHAGMSLVKIHIANNLADLGIFNEFIRYSVKVGLQGIAVASPDGRVPFAFLPEEISANDLIGTGGRFDVGGMAAYLDRTGRDGRKFTELLANLKTRILRFDVEARFYDGTAFLPTFRGHRLYGEAGDEDLRSSLDLAAQYLAGIVGPEGRFVYLYNPVTDAEESGYNVVRHAGTVYAMMELYQHSRSDEILEAAKRAIAYLWNATKPCPPPETSAYCVVEGGTTKLGANALAAVALAKYAEATSDYGHSKTMNRLCQRMVAIQRKSGEFYPHIQTYSGGGESRNFVSAYYPGEAILALTRVYGLDRDKKWLDAADAAANWLIAVRDRGKTIDKLDHDHWLLYGLNELYRYRKKPLFLDHARKIVDAIVAHQNTRAEYPDQVGMYGYTSNSNQVATRSEGLMAAWRLFTAAGDVPYAQKALRAAELGVRFQLGTQIREETAMYFPVPPKALGGFGRSLDDRKIQIDNVQHNVSAILALLKARGMGRGASP